MFRNKSTRTILVVSLFALLLTVLISLAFARSYRFYTEKVIGPRGGRLCAPEGTKLIILRKALKKRTLISMEIISDGDSRVEFNFGPHGLTFRRPAIIMLSWAMLKDVDEDELVLYYYDEESGEWVEETTAIWDKRHKRAIFIIDHFSRYYFDRR